MEEKILIFIIIVGAILSYLVLVFPNIYNILSSLRGEEFKEKLVPKEMVLQGGKRKRRNSRIKKRSN